MLLCLCRLRQCCCHLSLLATALDKADVEQNAEVALEVAMSALTLDTQKEDVDTPHSTLRVSFVCVYVCFIRMFTEGLELPLGYSWDLHFLLGM